MKVINFFEALGLPRCPWDKELGDGHCRTRDEILDEFGKVFGRYAQLLEFWIIDDGEIDSDRFWDSASPAQKRMWRHADNCYERATCVFQSTQKCLQLKSESKTDSDIFRLLSESESLQNLWGELGEITERRHSFDGEGPFDHHDELCQMCQFCIEDLEVINHKVKIRLAVMLRAMEKNQEELKATRRERDGLKASFERFRQKGRR